MTEPLGTRNDPAWLTRHAGRRVRVRFFDGEQDDVEGLLRPAQGRRQGKILTDGGYVVFFPLAGTSVTPVEQENKDFSQPNAVITLSSQAVGDCDCVEQGETNKCPRSMPSHDEAFERAWLRSARKGRAQTKGKFVDGQCRQHALAMLLAPKKFDWGQFMQLCGAFDLVNGFEKGTSAQWFVVGDTNSNIFSFVLQTKKLDARFIGPQEGSACEFEVAINKGGVRRAVVFNDEHAWAVRNLCGRWYSIDGAMGGVLTEVGRWTDGLGYVYVQEALF